jgi:23S rRNA (pseudouridine1915-N3)-methyltransferase
MLKVSVFAVGKLKETFWRDACAEYLKRLEGYANVVVKEIPDTTKEKEAQAILSALPEKTPVILLDIKGKPTSSEAFSQKLDNWALSGKSHLVFIIGGSDGVTEEVKTRASERMSFGPITLPHNLARVVFLEQLYRACKISRHEPYHK